MGHLPVERVARLAGSPRAWHPAVMRRWGPQGGYAAMALAAFHPDRFGFAGSLSGFLYPSSTKFNGAIPAGLRRRRRQHPSHVGRPPTRSLEVARPRGPRSAADDNNTRAWVYSQTTPWTQRPRRHDRPGRRGPGSTGSSTRSIAASAATTVTSTSRATAQRLGCWSASSAPCRATRRRHSLVPGYRGRGAKRSGRPQHVHQGNRPRPC